ncbi:Ig-like domain-containing protein [Arthrobacter sp. efr-133-R2A-120]|uniref:beta strand repeat-containing protein n=1 Tax=Arthrobacter sp. efr-133-R2A-120 TaxID=3040277 RepID=UPI00254C1EF3|nr:Ig-like domain-containing protein [Arthrobacter sp. efr-133-R2A-120]
MSTKPLHHMPLTVAWLRTRAPWVLIGILLVSGIGSAAYAFWQSISSSNFAAAAGDAVMPGSKPSASATGADISVSWTPGTTAGGRAVTGYTVARYNAATGGSKTPATGACAGTVTVLSCAEHNVPGGIWFYTVTPVIALWTGAESPRSDAVSSDSTPPVASVASISPTPNASGFNNSSPVIVNLTAQDNAGGSGVASITYAVDSGSQTTVNAANAAVTVSGDGTHVVSYFATDNAGNSCASQNLAIKIDTVAPGAPSIIVPTYVNSANVAAVPVNGTAEPGSTVTLTVTDPGAAHTLAGTVTVSGSGAWTATGLDLTSLNQGTVTYAAKATDAAGNTGSTVTVTSIKDTVAPAAPTISAPLYVNSANVANVPVNGTAEAGAAVTLVVTDAGAAHTVTQTATASGTGAWSTTGLNLTALNQGAVTYAATATDAAGNTGTTTTVTKTKDTIAPGLPSISVPPFVNSANVANVPVSGTAESGTSVSLTVTDPGPAHTVQQTVTASGTGAWSTTALNLTGLNQGTATYQVTATDAAGNVSATVTATNTKDTVSATPVVNAPAFVNGANVASVPVSGTSDAGALVSLTVTDVGTPTHTVSQTVTATGSGTWSISGLNLGTLNPGAISYSASATDPAGNVSAAGTASSTKDVVPPTVTGVALSNGGNTVGTADVLDSVTITYSERMDATKFCPGWNNTGTQVLNSNSDVVVTLHDNGSNDTLTVSSSACPSLNIGTVALGGNYVSSATATFQGSGNGKVSSVQWDPTLFKLTIVLGTNKTGTLASSVAGTPAYTPPSGLSDLAANPLGTTPFTSAGTSRF